jgi:hypothetical protein
MGLGIQVNTRELFHAGYTDIHETWLLYTAELNNKEPLNSPTYLFLFSLIV